MTLRDAEPAAMSVPIAHGNFRRLYAERCRDLVDGKRRRERTIRNRFLDRRQTRLELGVGLEPQVKPVLQHRPHPLDLLLTATRSEFARGGQLLAMRERLLPKLRD